MRLSSRPALVAGVVALLLALPTGAAAQAGAVPVTGAEIDGWFAADQMAIAGISLANGCHWIARGPKERRHQSVHCANQAPFSVVGEARLDGDRLCSKFSYPDGSRLDACQQIVRVGDNKYEIRVDGVARSVFYRLLR